MHTLSRTFLRSVSAAVVLGAFFGIEASGQVLDSSDTAIAIDTGALFALNGRYPAAESPSKLIDSLANTKYLNFGREGSGFIVTPSLSLPVDGFQITTANDSPGRDPSSFMLYGFSGALTTVDSGPDPAINADGLAEAWTLIASGPLSLPGNPSINSDQRGVLAPMVSVGSVVTYDHYKMIFPTVKDGGANSMQIAEIQFFADDTDPFSGILASSDSVIAVDETRSWVGSSFPDNERPARALDQLSNTKYLNFGKEGSGLIITNTEGPVQVGTMQLTTAGDAVDRDPASYELYGTNDAILSMQNTDGLGGENWMLISSGLLSLPGDRNDSSTFVSIDADAAYTSFKLVFPTLKNAGATNAMQIADVQFHAVPEPSSLLCVGLGAMMLMRRRRA